MALVSETKGCFYAVFNDWEERACSEFVLEQVAPHLEVDKSNNRKDLTYINGNKSEIRVALTDWLSQFESIQIWADVPHYDWVLFCDLFGGALEIPSQIHYMCMDLATLLLAQEKDIQKPRIEFLEPSEIPKDYKIHNALSDAEVGMLILKKVFKLKNYEILQQT